MQPHTYLVFKGQCEEAFNFYAERLGGRIVTMLTHEGVPAASQVPAEWKSKILHATIQVGDKLLMGADAPPEHYQQPQGFSVMAAVSDVEEAERVFHALADGGTVRMPIQQTFWSPRFGALIDRFGIPWMINCEQAPEGA
jgi:PhnB protein